MGNPPKDYSKRDAGTGANQRPEQNPIAPPLNARDLIGRDLPPHVFGEHHNVRAIDILESAFYLRPILDSHDHRIAGLQLLLQAGELCRWLARRILCPGRTGEHAKRNRHEQSHECPASSHPCAHSIFVC
jgi:hypothetical protein